MLIREEVHPWRIAMFRVRIRQAQRLECHPESMESFEPVRGMGVLLCAAPDRPEKVHAFPLDAPVCLNKGVWHEVIALSGEALYKITENCEVSSEILPLLSTGWGRNLHSGEGGEGLSCIVHPYSLY